MWPERVAGRGTRVAGVVAIILVLAALGPRLSAQTISSEFGVQAYAFSGDADRAGGGLYLARRAGPRGRISLFAGTGGGEGGASGRAEALVHLLLSPRRQRGAAPYLAGGLGLDMADGTEARLVALLGIEGSPGARQGWVIEGGVGGGWRVVAGWRWRR